MSRHFYMLLAASKGSMFKTRVVEWDITIWNGAYWIYILTAMPYKNHYRKSSLWPSIFKSTQLKHIVGLRYF